MACTKGGLIGAQNDKTVSGDWEGAEKLIYRQSPVPFQGVWTLFCG